MSIMKTIHCIVCLIKCSKYIYYVKKVICFFVIMLSLLSIICLCSDKNKELKKLLKEMKAVL